MNSNKEKSKKILVVDDEKYILRVVKLNLKRFGYEVFTARNGEEAIKSAVENFPDLILLDVMMPILDGFKVCEKLKANESTSKIPIIFLTARGRDADKSKAKELGAEAYLTKPFNIQVLRSIVQEKLNTKKE